MPQTIAHTCAGEVALPTSRPNDIAGTWTIRIRHLFGEALSAIVNPMTILIFPLCAPTTLGRAGNNAISRRSFRLEERTRLFGGKEQRVRTAVKSPAKPAGFDLIDRVKRQLTLCRRSHPLFLSTQSTVTPWWALDGVVEWSEPAHPIVSSSRVTTGTGKYLVGGALSHCRMGGALCG